MEQRVTTSLQVTSASALYSSVASLAPVSLLSPHLFSLSNSLLALHYYDLFFLFSSPVLDAGNLALFTMLLVDDSGFTHSVTNTNSFYSTDLRCPVTGVYEFSLSLLSKAATPLNANIAVGSHTVVMATQDNIAKSSATASFIVQCSAGEQVRVGFMSEDLTTGVFANSFSGELLFTDLGATKC